ncbi:MAG: 50S ribosomal protein L15 [Phycisphaerae bacterium]|nr:50S ribosomal protein L15 [Phycisphaerae bacterium]
MRLDEILHKAGRHRTSRRRGRGPGSGRGKTCGRGTKGMGARAGSGKRLGYEGGQNPVLARIPKRGFTNAPFRKEYQIVNVADLGSFKAHSEVDAAAMAQAGLVSDADKPVKVLGGGELTKPLTVTADRFSESARQKITQAGGTAKQTQDA